MQHFERKNSHNTNLHLKTTARGWNKAGCYFFFNLFFNVCVLMTSPSCCIIRQHGIIKGVENLGPRLASST